MGCSRPVQLSDVADLTPGFAFKSKDFGDYASKAIKITNVSREGDPGTFPGVNIDAYPAGKLDKYRVCEGDYYLAMTGSIGKVGRLVRGIAYLNQRVLGLRPKPMIDKDYLWFVLNSAGFHEHLLTHIDSHSVQANISARSVGSFVFDLPDMDLQLRITRILSAFDKKIITNARANGYLGELCESMAAQQVDSLGKLADICHQVNDKVPCDEAQFDSYVSTESLLPNKGGRQTTSSLPSTGKVTAYKAGDTLMSNIRPYFKKVWLADQSGTCSGDVIVFRANDRQDAAYVYSLIRSDSFFDFVMQGSKGTKMPRGDKKQMMEYPVSRQCNAQGLALLTSAAERLCANSRQNAILSELRDALLPKLMSGEIDVSKIKLPTSPNSHL